MLELQYEMELKAAKWYVPIDNSNAFFSVCLATECRPHLVFTWRGIQYTWKPLTHSWKHSSSICHGLSQTLLEQGEGPDHLQYIDDIVWGSVGSVREKEKHNPNYSERWFSHKKNWRQRTCTRDPAFVYKIGRWVSSDVNTCDQQNNNHVPIS